VAVDELEGAARAAGIAAGSVPVHLEIDTGMSRQGITPRISVLREQGVGALLGRFTPESPLRLEGVMTHLFAADEADGRVTEAQLGLLDEALGKVKAAGLDPEWLNVGASASLLAGEAAEDCRAGRSLRDEDDDASRSGALWCDSGFRPAV